MVTEVETNCSPGSLSVGLVRSRFNRYITEKLLKGAIEVLKDSGVPGDQISVYPVPGGFEIPGAARKVLDRREHDGIVCLGAVIRGETPHFDYICSHVTQGIGQLSLDAEIPVIFGILTTETLNQAMNRASSRHNNKGVEAAESLLQAIGLYQSLH